MALSDTLHYKTRSVSPFLSSPHAQGCNSFFLSFFLSQVCAPLTTGGLVEEHERGVRDQLAGNGDAALLGRASCRHEAGGRVHTGGQHHTPLSRLASCAGERIGSCALRGLGELHAAGAGDLFAAMLGTSHVVHLTASPQADPNNNPLFCVFSTATMRPIGNFS